jgi:hypothetical protein
VNTGDESEPNAKTWEAVQSLVQDKNANRDDSTWAASVLQAVRDVDPDNSVRAVGAAAAIIAKSGSGPRLALIWATSGEPLAAQLALTLAVLLPAPLKAGLVAALPPLLTRKRAPAKLQIAAAAALLRTIGKEGTDALPVINALVARCGKARAVERLNQLEKRAGASSLISERRTQLENRIRMRCPRCKVQLRRPQMAEHLWSEHSLLLDGRRVRHPWKLIEDWIAEYRRQEKPALLAHCRALGQHLDPEHGLQRVYRLFLAAGIAEDEARRVLLAEARQHHASLCPHCFAFVPVPQENMPRSLNQSHGRLSLGDYCVEVSERGLVPSLTITEPGGILLQGREPGQYWLTRKAATLWLVAPAVAAALGYAVLRTLWKALPVEPVMVCLLIGLVGYLATELYWWWQARPLDRSVDFAWTRLVPYLCSKDVTAEESTFLAGLALTTLGHGRPQARGEELVGALESVERAVTAGTVPLAHFAALQRLAVADAVATGQDPVPLVVDQVSRCFDGRLPLAFAQWLLAEWEGPWWTTGNLARLRVLLCDRAFEAGWEVADLQEAGFAAPALGDVVQTADSNGLARLRLLWSLRPGRPWLPWSEAVTVFELAEDPEEGRAWLHQYPDLLLLDEGSPTLIICGRGIVFHETLFTERPGTIDIKARRDFDGVEYELTLGDHCFHLVSDPAPVVARLEHWFRYYFGEFIPRLADVRTWKAPEGSKAAVSQEVVACPECRRLLLPYAGQVGRPMPNGSS